MIPALTIASLYEASIWTGAARAVTGVFALDIAYRTLKNIPELYNSKGRDGRKWAELGKNASAAAFFGFCTYKNMPTVAVVGILFYGAYAILKGAENDAYVTAKYARKPFIAGYNYLTSKSVP